MSGDSTRGIFSPSRNLLDRPRPQAQDSHFSEIQSDVDRLVGQAATAVSDEKTMVCLSGAAIAGRFVRLGALAATGKSAFPWAAQAFSHTMSLASESAVFAGLERKFAEGQARARPFQKDWARAFVNLGSLKLFGALSRSQNLSTQHLLIESAMVAGGHLGYALDLHEKPQGTLAQQMIQAEGMNLSMKGSLALLHGFSPRLLALEKSVDQALRFQERPLSSWLPDSTPIEKTALLGPEENLVWMSHEGQGPKGPPPPKIPRPAPGRLGAGPSVKLPPQPGTPPLPPPQAPAGGRVRPSLPPPPAPVAARPQPPRPSPVPPERVRLSFTPPAPSEGVTPLGQEQILALSRSLEAIPKADQKVLPAALLAGELLRAGYGVQGQEYFTFAANLIEATPENGVLRGQAFSHLALQRARIGDPEGARENFAQAMQVLNRLQENPRRSMEDTLDAFSLVFTLAGDLIAAGRSNTALQFLSIAVPNYRRVVGSRLPVGLGTEAVLQTARQDAFEGALILAGQLPSLEGQRKALIDLGKYYLRRQELQKAEEILWKLRGLGEKEILHAEVAVAHAKSQDWPLALRNLSALKDIPLRLRTMALLARPSLLFGNREHALLVHQETVAFFMKQGESVPPEAAGEVSALLAGNAALLGDGEGYSRFYYRAMGELTPWLESSAWKEMGEVGQRAVAELVFASQVASEGEKAGALLKNLDPGAKSWVLGETAARLAQVGRASIAIAWVGLIPEAERSAAQQKVALQLLDLGQGDRALPFAEKIPDPALRFEVLWEIFTRNRGATLPLPTPPARRPPPLPGSRG